ncbi:structural maintenance of chromosomes protein 1A isoform X1 [Schistocerca americana]|uniref:structural maintenance of chromosomes protein 1A isoform X1 n=1 Tax=Schistocerca americana TaxID=7009 RepID=UPI001F4FF0F7|nr:structural maintenance of chromosomes protein 1A isoform X1 [Schistocerca americana]XP_047112652.1 structural maintenance of chromosomes protein 1A isoform X1 [Schistocerca piceifrons]XP_049777030.1 structural maintenance of chromosomes protein 1A isoform X1 [Schistocerca cancellata]XP_049807753.1 structural maintenance of chromosomes protein 1A isoform X1 [Schistocerca nitens]XP_049958317.1 structural maintenance of chromosomes protein 1A isoform X1 [Schistocerca serialis cubense]
MPATLTFIEVENFKSYKGNLSIGPLKSFTAVIGPNGSGKSNFMDAVSFVMGEKTSCLRVKRLSDLIHGASIGQPISRSASVTAVFELEDGTEKRFTRIVQGSSSEHRINRESVSSQVYLADLEKLGINAKAKNFLVFQGAVESIAMKNPKERTALFEEISGSGALKEEYERLRAEMLKAEEETQFTYQKKRGIAAERKEAKLEKEEAEKYQRLKEDLHDKQVELQLFRLYHNEKDIEQLEQELGRKQHDVKKVEKRKQKAEEELKEKKKECGKISRELAKVEQNIREMEVEINKKRPTFIKAKERVAHIQKKLESARKSLAQAKKADAAHEQDIRELEDELAEVEARKREYEDMVAGESQSQGRDVHLEDAQQVQEYHRLKEEAGKRSAMYLQQLDSVNREQKSDQDRLDNEYRKKAEIENRLRQKGHEKDEAQKRIEKLAEHIKTSESALEDQRRLREDLQSDVGTSKERVQELQKELESVVEQLGDARVDKHEDSRRKKKQEIVENFKRLYPGVFDRMINMCQPIHKRYNVAITKVLGKYMEAIVVDTEKTARQCIQYLKEQMLEPETFLPLDYIQAKPLKERLRNIKEPKNVRLLFDVLHYQPPDIKRAVLFATNNALVCETPEDAMKVAYEMDKNRYDAVALDGTFYQKSGIISGGSLDLARKAKRWDEKHMSQLKALKEKLTEELRDSMKKSRKESELNTVDSQIRGLETRLKYSKTDRENTMKQIKQLEVELASLKTKSENFGPTIAEIERTMRNRDQQIQEIKENMNNVEDIVFASFCSQIGVANIRQYEERELRTQQERMKKRMEFENQKNRILNQLEFEKTRDTRNNVLRWERAVQDDEDDLETAKQAEQKQMADIERDMRSLDSLKSERMSKKAEVDNMEEEIGKARREMGGIAKDIQAAQKQVTALESKIEQRRADRHSILKQCKMEDIAIPMQRGNMEDIAQETSTGDNTETTSETNSLSTQQIYDRESRIVIDYGQLPDNLKELDDADDVKKMDNKLSKAINDLQNTIQRIQAPNMRAMQKLEMAREKLHETNEEFENSRRHAFKAKQKFERVKKERHDRFMNCFEHVANEIDNIYKSLAKNQSAQAFLGPENPEEPYLDGINYNCVAPGKRFQPMSNLSGGEKTVAALALLFAIHSYQPSPFFVLDEIDAALDNTNIGKVASYIRDKTSSLQTIVISLKEEFYSHADALIGICPDVGECLVSKVLTLDLTQYPSHLDAEQEKRDQHRH